MSKNTQSLYKSLIKPLFDFSAASIGLIVLSPIFLLLCILIKTSSNGPIFFTQTRIGKFNKPFKLYKFRSMVPNANKNGLSITSATDSRITPIGRFLRKTKLDELPQLLNVVIGKMSLVGPRPEVEKYVQLFATDYEKILTIKPGITDYAAIEFRNEEDILAKSNNPEKTYIEDVLPHKIKLYKKYIQNQSFITDLKIIFKTFIKIGNS